MATQGRSKDVGFNIFKEHEMDWVFHRTMTFMQENSADIGECLYTARNIDEHDGESWIDSWELLASRVEKQAFNSLENGHLVSARESFLRACNYYRTAEYGCTPRHYKFHYLWRKSVNCFSEAGKLFQPPIQRISINYKGKKLPGYFWRPDTTHVTRPTLIAAGGNDSSLEEVMMWTGMAAVRRGYNIFTFEHPGHRGAIHLYSDCIKQPDYEVPYKAAIDFLEALPGVDDRIAMKGYSFGGYVTCRVACHEKRLKAIIPSTPIIDAYRLFSRDSKDSIIVKMLPSSLLNKLVAKVMNKSPMRYSLAKYTMRSFGTPDLPWDKFSKFEAQKPFTCEDSLESIHCPVLALVGAGEGEEMKRQALEFINKISSKEKQLYEFTIEKDGGNDHCQLDSLARGNQVVFDWLDQIFEYRY